MIIGKAITAGGSGGIPCTLTVTTAEGALVEATLGSKKVSATAGADGTAILVLEKEGLWTISATLDGETKSTEVLVEHSIEESLTFFPEEPSSYEQLALITSSQTWTAPENGWFQIEVFGASGNGGAGQSSSYAHYGGGGGGGGGYACSRIKMNKGDTIALTVGAVGETSSATIESSLESYSELSVTRGANGTDGRTGTFGTGGAGGKARGGNYANENGGKGGAGTTAGGGAGGTAGYTGGNKGGAGGYTGTGASGSAGFVKIYRGNTN